jgi:hypothetical protein
MISEPNLYAKTLGRLSEGTQSRLLTNTAIWKYSISTKGRHIIAVKPRSNSFEIKDAVQLYFSSAVHPFEDSHRQRMDVNSLDAFR